MAPRVRLMAENNARQGFVTPADFETIVAALPEYLQDVARFGYVTGWPVGEILTLEWAAVDLERRQITLRREHSKNGQPRTIPFVGMLGETIVRWHAARGDSLTVFHRQGRPILDFACPGGRRVRRPASQTSCSMIFAAPPFATSSAPASISPSPCGSRVTRR